ncbi:MAG: histidine phosphatase family protein [Paenirhodobacter sp.]|uniref:histidine phosphatase family protein n=1 Tax=Paenirhodobacter sp. TaxID=1965326 RepID=UPI003D11C199
MIPSELPSDIPSGGFLFLRHGRTAANARDLICGRTDLPLDATGRLQAAAAAVALARFGIARIVTSPLTRARQTAAAVAAPLGLVPELVPGLAERDWGAWEGQPRAGLRRAETPPGGESPAAFRARIRAAFAALSFARPLLIVAHSGTEREIHALLSTAPHRRRGNAEAVLWSPGAEGWICHEAFKPGG